LPTSSLWSDRNSVMPTVLTAIPVYNEHEHIDDVLRSVRAYSDFVLAVDDGSTDGTPELLKKHRDIQVITHPQNMGYGQSLIDAFGYAAENNFDWIITIDCDLQHQPCYIPEFVRHIEADDVDVVSGSRYLAPVDCGTVPPPDRAAINKKITQILNDKLKLNLTDSFCGYKAYRVKAVRNLDLTEKGYGLPMQFWVRASRARLTIREIPVPLIYHDPKRNFGCPLADPEVRLNYYLQILERELSGETV